MPTQQRPNVRTTPKPADEPGQCPVCASPVTTRPYRKSEHGYLLVYCFGCRTEQRIGC